MVFFHARTKLIFAELDGVYFGRRALAFVLLGFWSHFSGGELVRHPELDIRKGNRDLFICTTDDQLTHGCPGQ